MKLKITKNKIIAAVAVVCVLAIAFFWGGNYANKSGRADTLAADTTAAPIPEPTFTTEQVASPSAPSSAMPEPTASPSAKTAAPTQKINADTGKDQFQTEPVPSDKPVPVEPQDVQQTDSVMTCTMSITCKTLLTNTASLNPDKRELVPEDGVILPQTSVTFHEGESVFNVLQRETKRSKIHLEFVKTPAFNSAYIEGIHNLYEFDCGELSGWMYKVNGWFPNYGCSRYQLKDGDVIEWIYTCDLGRDIGGYIEGGQQQR